MLIAKIKAEIAEHEKQADIAYRIGTQANHLGYVSAYKNVLNWLENPPEKV